MPDESCSTRAEPNVEALGGTVASDRLPTVPTVALTIMAKCKVPDVDFGELASLVSADPALATRFLTLANSGIFGGRHRITSLRTALVRLGLRLTHATSLAFALAARDMAYAPGFEPERFWRFALTTSHAAHAFAEQTPDVEGQDAYAAGLLQDIGILALQSAVPEKYGSVMQACRTDPALDRAEVEQDILGTTHMLVGGYLLREWGLPPEIYRAITFHQCPADQLPDDLTEETAFCCRLLRVADMVGKVFNGPDRNIQHEKVLRMAEEELGLARSRARELLDEVEQGVRSTAAAFDIDPETMASYVEIRAASLRQIGRLAAEMEADFRRYRAEARETREELEALHAHREELKEQLNYDDLTSLLRRAEFQRRCEDALAYGGRTDSPLSIFFLDIDHFKRVNDEFGHSAGDQALKSFGEYLLDNIRRNDIAARYGGDEFAVLLPDTGLDASLHLAERLRIGVARKSVHWVEGVSGFTVSGGVVHLRADHAGVTVEDLLEEADRCLYVAKSEGRNCTRSTVLPRDN